MKSLLFSLLAATSAIASESVFSVHDDVLAFPQFEIAFLDSYITEQDAAALLPGDDSPSNAENDVKNELSQPRTAERASTQTSSSSNPDTVTKEYIRMLLHNQPYLCAIPEVEENRKNLTNETVSLADETKELARAADRGWELLQDMEGKCMYFVSGWWSYSFCYKTQIKQFHQLPPGNGAPIYPPTEDPTTPSYVLGDFKSGKDNKDGFRSIDVEVRTQGETRYLVQNLGGGTTCDLTGKERRVEVQYHCSPSSTDRLGWIKEVSTCTYLLVIYTPRLCNDIAFLPPRENKANPINCKEILKPGEIAGWEWLRSQEAQEGLLKIEPEEEKVIVGGIEVGAKAQVGQEGKTIEKGRVASENQESTDIVAKKENGKIHQLSKEELEKFNLDSESIDSMMQEMEDLAGPKDWKLEVVDGPGGVRELRGVVHADPEESEESEGNKEASSDKDEGSEEGYKEEL